LACSVLVVIQVGVSNVEYLLAILVVFATPEISRVFGLDAVHEALRLMQQGVHFGKVLVEFP